MPRHDDDPRPGGTGSGAELEETVVPLHVEEIVVSRRQIEKGVVRIATRTRTVEKLVEEPLARQRAEIRHVPLGRVVDRVPEIRQEGDTTIIPVVEEIVVVERRLFLKEEVHVRRVRTTGVHAEKVLLRQQDVVVTRTPAGDAVPPKPGMAEQTEINPRTEDEFT